jgi:glutaredoxin 3
MISIYSKDNCVYCGRAKRLLSTRGISYREQTLEHDFTREDILEKFPSARTFPIVAVDGKFIGGYDNLVEYVGSMTENQLLLEKTNQE